MKVLKLYFTLLLLYPFIAFQGAHEKMEPLKIGDSAPLQEHLMRSTENEKLSLKNLMGDQGLVVVFSCNTCPFVIGGENFAGWEKDYNDLAEIANRNGLNFVLINSNEAKRSKGDGLKDMKKRKDEKNYSMKYLLDKNHELADAFGAKTTPHIFLFDNDFKLAYEGAIDNSWNPSEKVKETYLSDAIEAVGSGSKILNPKTAPKGCSIKRK
ncbi:MAG: redoxin domain-containing protein [Brumimicrobium sp.]|nr:redoxin domain-containing protein [Brumimicrobium sp.]